MGKYSDNRIGGDKGRVHNTDLEPMRMITNKIEAHKHLDRLLDEIASMKLEQIKQLIKTTPNDTELGRELRKLFTVK